MLMSAGGTLSLLSLSLCPLPSAAPPATLAPPGRPPAPRRRLIALGATDIQAARPLTPAGHPKRAPRPHLQGLCLETPIIQALWPEHTGWGPGSVMGLQREPDGWLRFPAVQRRMGASDTRGPTSRPATGSTPSCTEAHAHACPRAHTRALAATSAGTARRHLEFTHTLHPLKFRPEPRARFPGAVLWLLVRAARRHQAPRICCESNCYSVYSVYK